MLLFLFLCRSERATGLTMEQVMRDVSSSRFYARQAQAPVVLDTVEKIRAPMLRRLYEYWLGKHRDGMAPGRADIDPLEMREALPYLWLVDIERDPLRFRFRLVGTRITEWAGHEYTGVYVETETYGSQAPAIAAQYREVVERRQPMWHQQYAPWFGREFRFYEKIMLPLCGRDGEVEMLLCGMMMREPPGRH